jgi:hypothetical protein
LNIPPKLKATWEKVSKDGQITKQEFQQLKKVAEPTGKASDLSLEEALFLSAISIGIDKSPDKEGIAVKNINFLPEEDKPPKVTFSDELPPLEGLPGDPEKDTSKDYELFPNGVQDINASNVIQGSSGLCYLLSAIASLAENRPKDIMNMIKDNGNNTYTVTFPGVRNGTVTVQRPTDYELKEYTEPGHNSSIWAAVMTKAYMKLDLTANFGSTDGTGITIITGHSVDTDILALTSKDETRKKLKIATQGNKIITAGINGLMGGVDENNIVSKHTYSVLSYDEKTDTVKVRNPWGILDFKNIKHPDKSQHDGTFTLTIDEFDAIFSNIAYEENSNSKKFNFAGIVAF